MTTLEHRAKAMSRLADEARATFDNALLLANDTLMDEASDLLILADDTVSWAEELGPDAEAWAAKVAKQAGSTFRLVDFARLSLDLVLAQLEILTDEINRHPA